MDKERTKAWVERVKDDSAMTRSFLLTQWADDSFGWGKILKNMWFPTGEELPTGTGVLLVGPAGCGKHTAIHHLLRLMDQLPKQEDEDGSLRDSYLYVSLDWEELLEPEDGFAACEQMLSMLLDDCYDRHQGLFLVLEGTTRLPWSRKLYRYLGSQLTDYYLYRGKGAFTAGPKDRPASLDWEEDETVLPPFFLALIEEEEPMMPALLRSRLQLCRMSRPNLLRRKNYLMNRDLGNLHMDMDELHPGQTLADLTEGLSYAQLEDLVNSLSALTAELAEPVELAEEDSLRQEQTPQETLPELQRQVWEKAESLMDKLPEMLAQRSYIIPEPSREASVSPERESDRSSEPAPVSAPNYDPATFNEEDELTRLNTMPVKNLAIEFFQREIKLVIKPVETPEREAN